MKSIPQLAEETRNAHLCAKIYDPTNFKPLVESDWDNAQAAAIRAVLDAPIELPGRDPITLRDLLECKDTIYPIDGKKIISTLTGESDE